MKKNDMDLYIPKKCSDLIPLFMVAEGVGFEPT